MSDYTNAYVDLLIKQYWEKPNARAEIAALAGSLEPVRDMYVQIPDAFDIDQAVGVQLDILGRIIGLDRLLPFILQRIAFGFWDRELLISALAGSLGVTGGGPVTFARASVGYYWDTGTGLLTQAIADAARFENVGGVERLLIEAAGANVLAATHRTAADWALIGGTGTKANDAVGIDGGVNAAVTLTDTDAAVISAFSQTKAGLTSGNTTNPASLYVKKGSAVNIPQIVCNLTGGTPISMTARIDTTTGQLDSAATAGIYVEDAGNWWRVCFPIQDDASGNTSQDITINPAARATLEGANDAALSGSVIVDWPQIERGVPLVTSPIDGAGTRADETVSLPNADVPDLSIGAIFSVNVAIPNDGQAHCLFSVLGGGGDTYLQRGVTGVLEGAFGGVPFTSTFTPDEAEHRYLLETEGDELVVKQDDTDVFVFTGSPKQPTGDLFLGSYGGTSAFLNDHIGEFRIGSPLGNAYSKGFDDKFAAVADVAPFFDKFEPARTPLELGDSDYRLFLKMKIARNHGSPYMLSISGLSIQEAIQVAFDGQAYVIDNKDMSLDLYVDPGYDIDRLLAIVSLDLLPKPQGVRYATIVQAVIGATFGFSDNANSQPFADKFDLVNQPGGRFASKVVF